MKVLIVDDEQNIRETVADVLTRNQFEPILCGNPLEALPKLLQEKISLVILDVWMPELDGHELLQEIKREFPNLPVLVISGHINIHTSVELVKKGATDFLEKPFSSDFLLFKVNKLLQQEEEEPRLSQVNQQRFTKKISKKQKTIKKNVVLTGQGLHKGENNGIILSPLQENSGIIFQNIATNQTIPARIENVAKSNFYSTTLKRNNFELTLIEHLLSALHIYGINNINIKVSGEIPIFDGSAQKFCDLIEEAGIKEQEEEKNIFVIDQSYRLVDEKNPEIWCEIEPDLGFKLAYTLDFPEVFGKQFFEIDLSDPEERVNIYKKEISQCRTFGFLEEIRYQQTQGLAKGGNFESGIIIDRDRVINTQLKFQNEFARHKVLDMIGDLYLFGSEIQGKITGHFSGHRHTINLQKKILSIS